MASQFAVLPSDILQLLSSLDGEKDKTPLHFLRLPHPRTGLPALFLPTEWLPRIDETASRAEILEVHAVCPPEQRSWILGESIIADGKMLVMTPIDPAFLLLPLIRGRELVGVHTLLPADWKTKDDIFEAAVTRFEGSEDTTKHLHDHLMLFFSLECTRKALPRLCEVKEISSDIVVYRYSSTKCIEFLQAKVEKLESSSAFNNSRTVTRNLAKDCLMDDGQESLLKLGRLRSSCDLVAQYLPTDLRDVLVSSYDFTALYSYVESKKAEAILATAQRAPNKTKGAEKETAATSKKRKSAKASQGIANLKKVNTTGMAKISSFFNKRS